MRLPAFGRVKNEYDRAFMERMAQAYVDQTPWTEIRLAAVRDLVEPKPGDRVVDLGCAAGAITHYLTSFGCDVVGVDSEPLAIEAATDLFPDLRFELADVTRLPFDDASLDKAVAADLVEHLDHATFAGMLAEVKRVLVPGGTLSLYTPNPLHLVERMKEHDLVLAQNPTHIGLRNARELTAGLEQAGYEIEVNSWRPSFVRVLRSVERIAGPRLQLFRYRLCLRARVPER
jgi:SAM-dependent methyltransferase